MNSAVSNDQIVATYEQSDGVLSIEDMVEAFDGEINASIIKMALMNGSKLFRKRVKDAEEEIWSKDDDEMTKTVLRNLCIGADSDMVKLRAATRIRDERMGVINTKGMARTANISVTLMQHFSEAEKAIEASKAKVIEINPQHEHLKLLTEGA